MATPEGSSLAAHLDTMTIPTSSISALVGMPSWLVIAVALAVIVGTLLAQRSVASARGGLGFGIMLGGLGVAAWVAGQAAGWHWGLSVTGPTRSVLVAVIALDPARLDWGAAMVASIPAGAWIAARRAEPITWRPVTPPAFARRAFGGLLMGMGGTLAAGCNIGNALTGLAVLAVNSAVATVAMVIGVAGALMVGRLTDGIKAQRR
jgi:hypothetical protein